MIEENKKSQQIIDRLKIKTGILKANLFSDYKLIKEIVAANKSKNYHIFRDLVKKGLKVDNKLIEQFKDEEWFRNDFFRLTCEGLINDDLLNDEANKDFLNSLIFDTVLCNKDYFKLSDPFTDIIVSNKKIIEKLINSGIREIKFKISDDILKENNNEILEKIIKKDIKYDFSLNSELLDTILKIGIDLGKYIANINFAARNDEIKRLLKTIYKNNEYSEYRNTIIEMIKNNNLFLTEIFEELVLSGDITDIDKSILYMVCRSFNIALIKKYAEALNKMDDNSYFKFDIFDADGYDIEKEEALKEIIKIYPNIISHVSQIYVTKDILELAINNGCTYYYGELFEYEPDTLKKLYSATNDYILKEKILEYFFDSSRFTEDELKKICKELIKAGGGVESLNRFHNLKSALEDIFMDDSFYEEIHNESIEYVSEFYRSVLYEFYDSTFNKKINEKFDEALKLGKINLSIINKSNYKSIDIEKSILSNDEIKKQIDYGYEQILDFVSDENIKEILEYACEVGYTSTKYSWNCSDLLRKHYLNLIGYAVKINPDYLTCLEKRIDIEKNIELIYSIINSGFNFKNNERIIYYVLLYGEQEYAIKLLENRLDILEDFEIDYIKFNLKDVIKSEKIKNYLLNQNQDKINISYEELTSLFNVEKQKKYILKRNTKNYVESINSNVDMIDAITKENIDYYLYCPSEYIKENKKEIVERIKNESSIARFIELECVQEYVESLTTEEEIFELLSKNKLLIGWINPDVIEQNDYLKRFLGENAGYNNVSKKIKDKFFNEYEFVKEYVNPLTTAFSNVTKEVLDEHPELFEKFNYCFIGTETWKYILEDSEKLQKIKINLEDIPSNLAEEDYKKIVASYSADKVRLSKLIPNKKLFKIIIEDKEDKIEYDYNYIDVSDIDDEIGDILLDKCGKILSTEVITKIYSRVSDKIKDKYSNLFKEIIFDYKYEKIKDDIEYLIKLINTDKLSYECIKGLENDPETVKKLIENNCPKAITYLNPKLFNDYPNIYIDALKKTSVLDLNFSSKLIYDLDFIKILLDDNLNNLDYLPNDIITDEKNGVVDYAIQLGYDLSHYNVKEDSPLLKNTHYIEVFLEKKCEDENINPVNMSRFLEHIDSNIFKDEKLFNYLFTIVEKNCENYHIIDFFCLDSIVNNQNYVKRILDKFLDKYYIDNFIFCLSPKILDNELYEKIDKWLEKRNNVEVEKCIKLLSDKKCCEIFFKYYPCEILKIAPVENITEYMALTAMINQYKLDEDSNVFKSDKVSLLDLNEDNFARAVKNKCKITNIGLKYDTKILILYIRYKFIDNSKMLTEILKKCNFFSVSNIDYKEIIKEYLKQGNLVENDLLTYIKDMFYNSDILIEFFNENATFINFFNNETLLNNLKNLPKFENEIKNNALFNTYVSFYCKCPSITEYITKIDDINFYFNNFGPTNNLFEKALLDFNLMHTLYDPESEYVSPYINNQVINSYINFMFNCNYMDFNSFVGNYIHTPDEIMNIFDENGIKEDIIKGALFNYNLFNIIFCHITTDKYNLSPAIKSYIEFTKTYNFILLEYINSIEDIEEYFNDGKLSTKIIPYFYNKEELFIIESFINNKIYSIDDLQTVLTPKEVTSVIEFINMDTANDLKKSYINFIFQKLENGERRIDIIPSHNISMIAGVLNRLEHSNSSDLRVLKNKLADSLLRTDNPLESLKELESIYLSKSSPIFIKLFETFKKLYPDLENSIARISEISSPVLQSCINEDGTYNQEKIDKILVSDLVRASVDSNNKQIQDLINILSVGYKLPYIFYPGYDRFKDENKSSIEDMQSFFLIIKEFIEIQGKDKIKLNNLYENDIMDVKDLALENIVLIINYCKEHNIIKTTKEYKIMKMENKISFNYEDLDILKDIVDSFVEIYFKTLSINNLEELKNHIAKNIEATNEKNRRRCESGEKIIPEDGDLIKGIYNSSTMFYNVIIQNILSNGMLCKEFLGYESKSDCTPLDTDFSIYDSSVSLGDMQSSTFGNIKIILKNIDDRFNITKRAEVNCDKDKPIGNISNIDNIEAFNTLKFNQYGIRTGIPISEIDAFICYTEYDNRLGLEIAKTGIYIPVVDSEGNYLFTWEDFQKYRHQMEGLSYYELGDVYTISKNLRIDNDIDSYESKIDETKKETSRIKAEIEKVVGRVLEKHGIKLKTYIDGDLTPGTAELLDTGSTSRGTCKPNDTDFDFMLRFDNTVYDIVDEQNNHVEVKKIIEEILSEFNVTKQQANSTYLKVRKAQAHVKFCDKDVKFELDISSITKVDRVDYSTDNCLSDRLDNIKSLYPKDYSYVLANIVKTKALLKAASIYKKTEKGIGGIGVENWILQNGGSLYDAATSFIKAAEEAEGDFEKFQKIYSIIDFGKNHMVGTPELSFEQQYCHDNFVYFLTPNTFKRMLYVCKEYKRIIDTKSNEDLLLNLKSEKYTNIVLFKSEEELINNIASMLDIEDVSQIRRSKIVSFGYVYEFDKDGITYIIKPGVNKSDMRVKPGRVEMQSIASKLQKYITPGTGIDVLSVGTGPFRLAVQPKYQTSKCVDLIKEHADELLGEYVVDYLLGNFEVDSRNFIVDFEGHLRGIDKSQGLQNLMINGDNVETLKLNFGYVPENSRPSIYYEMFERYKNGEIDLNFDILYAAINRLKFIKEKDYINLFREYIELYQPDNPDEKINQIIARKNYLINNLESFIESLNEKRKNITK